jgi:hypothetical protein
VNVEAANVLAFGVVRQWAYARKFMRGHGFVAGESTWCFEENHATGGLLVQMLGSDGRYTKYWHPSPLVALAWAIVVESEAASVYVGKCKATQPDPNGFPTTYPCRRGAVPKWIAVDNMSDDNERPEFTWWMRDGAMTCPACGGTTLAFTPLAVLLLDVTAGDETGRANLSAHQDQLLAVNNPIGELIAWVLNLWTREEVDVTHVDEAARWLEWLLWGNWFAERQRTRAVSEARRADYTVTGRLHGTSYDLDIMDDLIAGRPDAHWYAVDYASVERRLARLYGDSLFAELTFGSAGETFTIEAGGRTYSVTLDAPTTARALAAAFNQQGGPATFAADENGLTMDFHDTGSSSFVLTSVDPAARLLDFVAPQIPEKPRHQPHARHIGAQLGRRLGVRR